LPLIHFINKPQFNIGIWRIEDHEYNPVFSRVLHPNYHHNFNSYKNNKRKIQIHASKLLFEQLSPGNELYLKNNKPHIRNSDKFVSISHTKDIIAMIIAKYPCGIDIESSERDTSKIKHKFLNDNDFTSGESNKNLIQNWCSKEVLFKINGFNDINFKQHLTIRKNGEYFSGYCNHPMIKFNSTIKILKFKNYCLAFNTNYTEEVNVAV
jgi:phosphopantetheinyl transferase